jgi:hypothetical protein
MQQDGVSFSYFLKFKHLRIYSPLRFSLTREGEG